MPKPTQNQENEPRVSMRTKLGWIIFVMACLIVYGIVRYYTLGDVSFFELNRLFIILFLLWLAWPELAELPKWILTIVPICAIACSWRPQLLVVVLPVTILYLFLRPPAKRYARKKRVKSNALTTRSDAKKN
ncbi:MAG: hypothetical protein Q4G03_06345 [Planctomycetia bacterium]|nr:hypothetical protein [Planctomycetia bacterium]